MKRMLGVLVFSFLLSSTYGAEFYLTAQPVLGYCGLPDELNGTVQYYYRPIYATAETGGNQLMTVDDNRFSMNLKSMGRTTFGWNYAAGFFLGDHVGVDVCMQYGLSLSEDLVNSDYSLRVSDNSYYGYTIPHDYYTETGKIHETLSLAYDRLGFRFRYRHPINRRLSAVLGLGPYLSDTRVNHVARIDKGTRHYYQNNGNEVYSETIHASFEQNTLHFVSVETVPDLTFLWRISRTLDLHAGIAIPFSTIKTIGLGDHEYYSDTPDLVLDQRFWLTHAQFSLGVVLSIRKE